MNSNKILEVCTLWHYYHFELQIDLLTFKEMSEF